MPGFPRRRRTDRLYRPPPIGPREQEAAIIIESLPGISVEGLAVALGVSMGRTWQIVGRLERLGYLQRQPGNWTPPRQRRTLAE